MPLCRHVPLGHRLYQPGDNPVRVVLVLDELQYRHQHDANWLAEVQQLPGLGEDRADVADISIEVAGGAFRVAGQQRP